MCKEANPPKVENTAKEETKENVKEFNAYLEIYNDEELITKVFGNFCGDAEKLTEDDLYEIKVFLLIRSGIPRSDISHTVFSILDFDDNEHCIDFLNDEEYGEDLQ